MPSLCWNRNGSETCAIDWAMKEHTELATDSANSGMRSRSTGSIGARCVICRTTSTTPVITATVRSMITWKGASPCPISEMPISKVPNATVCSAALEVSNCAPEWGVSGKVRQARMPATMPSGTFTANSHGQGATDRIPEATDGPTAEAIEPMVAFSPTPRPSMRRG